MTESQTDGRVMVHGSNSDMGEYAKIFANLISKINALLQSFMAHLYSTQRYYFSALTLLFACQEEHQACNN